MWKEGSRQHTFGSWSDRCSISFSSDSDNGSSKCCAAGDALNG